MKLKHTEAIEEMVKEDIAYASFGDKISDEGVLTPERMMEKYNGMKAGDTLMN